MKVSIYVLLPIFFATNPRDGKSGEEKEATDIFTINNDAVSKHNGDSSVTHSDILTRGACTVGERSIWSNNRPFTVAYQDAAREAWGDKDKTTNFLHAKYPSISRECLNCLGEATACGKSHCMFVCVWNIASSECRQCIDTNCTPQLMICSGASNTDELPLPPESDSSSDSISPVSSKRVRQRNHSTTPQPEENSSAHEGDHSSVNFDLSDRLRSSRDDESGNLVLNQGANGAQNGPVLPILSVVALIILAAILFS
jgi:hypothetical protein